jgi:hypothetical protein
VRTPGAFAAVFACVNYKSPERQVAEEMLKHRTIKWEHDGKTEYFMTWDFVLYKGDGPSGAYFEGPASTGVPDCNWHVNDKGGEAGYSITYTNKGLTIMIHHIGDAHDRREYISYEQLLKSKEIELIESDEFFAVQSQARSDLEEAEALKKAPQLMVK